MVHYRITYKRLSNSTTTIDILENGYGGSIIPLTGNTSPLQISTAGDLNNIFESTVGSGALIRVIATPLSLLGLFTNDSQKFVVKCYNGSSGTNLFWQGYVNAQGGYQEDYSSSIPVEITINANDGMGVLDTLFYKNSAGTPYTGTATIGAVLNNIISKLSGVTFNNLYSNNDLSTNGYNYNLYNNIKVNQENYIDESNVSMTCREVLNSIMGGLGLVIKFVADKIYIIDPINLKDSSKGETYTLPTFSESSTTLGGKIDLSGGTIGYYETGQGLDIVSQVDEVDVKYDPYTFLNYSYDFNDVKNLASAGGWGHITTPSAYYYTNNPSFFGWTQSSGAHFVGVAEDIDGVKGDPTYMLWLTNTNLYSQPVLTLQLPPISLYKDSQLSLKISLDAWFQTKENNYNIFAAGDGNQVYGYYVQTSIKIGNQYYNGSSWTTGFTHNLIAVKSCTSAEFVADNANSTANDTWITASINIPLDSSLVGSSDIEFCVYDYWDGSQTVTKRHNFSPVIGILLKNLSIGVINTNTGKEIDNSGVLKRGNISTNLIYKSNTKTIDTTNGTGVYGVSKGAYRDSSNAIISSLYRGGYYTTEQLVLQSFLSQYKVPRIKLNMILNVKNYLLDIYLKLITDYKYQTGKAFYIVSSTYDDENESMEIEAVELTNSRESL